MNRTAKTKCCSLVLTLAFAGSAFAAGETNIVAPSPVTARDFYNAGTKLLDAKKFFEAEQMFQSALATQDARVQPAALYNLGHARFDDGAEALKKKPDADSTAADGSLASADADAAIQRAQSALAGDDEWQMIAAYLAGGGARHDVKDAQEALQQAMATYGDTLRKWQHAEQDFKSAAELNPADTNATRNAEIVEQHIARLVDSLRKMQQMANQLANQHSQLNDLLAQLAGRIPKQDMPRGEGGDDDEGILPESLRGMTEGAYREGNRIEVPLSPDEAEQILKGILPGGTERLPMNESQTGKPAEKNSLTW